MSQLICHITSVHKRDDIRIFVKECLSLAKQKDYEVVLIVADSLGDDTINQVRIIDVSKPSSRLKRMLNTPQAIYAQVMQLKPQIVHFHDPELMFIGLKLQRAGIKVIYDAHEDLPKQILSKTWINKWLRNPLAYVVKHIEHYCVARYAGVITATHAIADRLGKYNKQIQVIHNYPLLSELATIDTPWHKRHDTLGYIGSISQARGILPLVQSLSISKLPLELAGMFSDDVSLALLASEQGYEYVNYLGVLNRVQISQLLSTIKIGMVTLLPTPSYVESLPIKLFEYMLAGIPVVASNFTLWQDIIKKLQCGMLVDPTSPKEIAQACSYLLTNPEIAEQMGQNGREAVIKHFNWEVEATNLYVFYGKVLSIN